MDKYSKCSTAQLFEEVKKLDQSDQTLRTYLIRLLWSRYDSTPYVINLLTEAKPEIKNMVLRLMPAEKGVDLVAVLVSLLRKGKLKNRRIIVEKLKGVQDPKAISALLERIMDPDEDVLLKKKAVQSLEETGIETVADQLVAYFDQANTDVQVNILIALSKIANPKVVPLMQKSFYHEEKVIRLWALKAMKTFPQHVEPEEIFHIVESEQNVDIKAAAIQLLCSTGNAKILEFLVLQLLENKQTSAKYDILQCFKKYDQAAVKNMLYKKRKEVFSKSAQKIMEEALEFLEGIGTLELSAGKSIYRTWRRSPFSYPDTSEISFFKDGKGVYQEIKAGEVELNRPFQFIEKSENIQFITTSGQELNTKFWIEEGFFPMPYEKEIPCLVLRFANQNIYIEDVNITGTPYYYLK